MDPFSKSSGVQADPPAASSNNDRKKKKTGLVPIRFLAFLLLVGSSINRMRQHKSSYIKMVVDSLNDSSNLTPVTHPPARNFDQKPSNTTGRPSDNVRNVTADFEAWTKPYWNQTNATYSFPSVDYRLRYYMGSWYDKHLASIDCSTTFEARFVNKKFSSKMHDKDILYSYDFLSREIQTSTHWNNHNYLKYYHKVLRNSTTPQNTTVAMCVGDSSSIKSHVPVAAKTRKAGFDNPTSENNYFGIIWPLNMVRHFGPVQEYLELEQAGNVTAWENKRDAIIWRGGYTGIPQLLKGDGYHKSFHKYGPRVQAVLANCFHNQSEIDVSFLNMLPKKNGVPVSLNKTLQGNCVRESHSSMQEQLEYKYILNVEGNDVSSGLKWQLASNSVVFMAKPTTVSWAMEDQLVPFYHYIPVDDNFENLPQMIHWAKTHDEQAKKIALQSTQYMYDLWISDKAQQEFAELHTLLATKYEAQFSNALAKCLTAAYSKPQYIKRLPQSSNNRRSSTTLVKRPSNKRTSRIQPIRGKK